MKTLQEVETFGSTDADNDSILLQSFEDHEAYQDVVALRRQMIIGKKGSGKTAIFKNLITTKEPDFFCFGHTFSDYAWHCHELQARIGIPDFDKYTHPAHLSPLNLSTENHSAQGILQVAHRAVN
jgi:hypothetical protein